MLLLTTSTWTPAPLLRSWTWLSLHLQASTHLLQVKYPTCSLCLTHYTEYNLRLFRLISLPIRIGFTFHWLILFQMHPLEFVWYIFIMHRKLKILFVMPYYTLYNSQASINNCNAGKSVYTCWFFLFLIRIWASNVSPHESLGSTYAPSIEHETSRTNPLPLSGPSAHGCPRCPRFPSRRLTAGVTLNCVCVFLSSVKSGRILQIWCCKPTEITRGNENVTTYRITPDSCNHLQCCE